MQDTPLPTPTPDLMAQLAGWWDIAYAFFEKHGAVIQSVGALLVILTGIAGTAVWCRHRIAAALSGLKQRWWSSSSPTDSPRQLRRVDPVFVGRDAILKDLENAVTKRRVRIIGLFGTGGLGKTELARNLGQRLARRIPGPQIEVDLHGFTRGVEPLDSAAIYAAVLHAFDRTAPTNLPVEQLEGDYHAALARRRGILIFDNVRDVDQLDGLLPPTSWLMIVTSRHRFPLATMHAPHIDVLAPPDAERLILDLAPSTGTLATAIAEQCGYIPQVLRLAAGTLAPGSSLSPRTYLGRLRTARGRLELTAASLEVSMQALPEDLRHGWLALAVFPSDFDADAAAAIWGEIDLDAENVGDDWEAAVTEAATLLDRLQRASLLQWDQDSARHRMHDLLREFALDRLAVSDRQIAQARHAAFYTLVLGAADERFLAGGDGVLEGLSLLDREWLNAQAAQVWAAEHLVGCQS